MSEFNEELLKAADEILEKVRQRSLGEYFVYGSDRPIPLKVTSRSGQLVQAVTRATTLGDRAFATFTNDGMVVYMNINRSEYPHATLIHEGGVRVVTEAMRRFFWARWRNTKGAAENKMWSILRFRNIIRYEPRKFFENAIMDVAKDIPEILREHAIIGLMTEIKKIITGALKAVPLSAIK